MRVGARVAVKGAGVRVVPGTVAVGRGRGSLVGGGARAFALGCAGRGVGRVVTLVGGTVARVGACTGGGGAADTLGDRSRRDALIGLRAVSKTFPTARKVGRVATMDWILPSWVVMVSS